VADQTIKITEGSGKALDVTELTVGANTVERERINIADPATAAGLAKVLNAAPVGTEYGLVTWNIPSGTQSVSGTVTTTPPANASTNVTQFGGTNVSTGTGAGGAGIPRVTVSSDSSLAANQSVNVNQIAGSGVSIAAAGVQKVGVSGAAGAALDASGQNAASPANELLVAGQFNTIPTTITSGNVSPVQLDSVGSLKTNTNVTLFGGNPVATGTGAGGVGIPRVTISNDSSLAANQSVNVAQIAGTNTATAAAGLQKVGITGNTGAAMDAAGQNAASPANELLVAGQFNSAPTTITTGNVSPLQVNSKGELLTQITDGTTLVAVIAGTTALKTDMSSVAGTATGTAAAGVQKVGIVGNAGAIFDAAGQNAASPANEILVGGQFNTAPTAITSGNMSPLQVNSKGELLTQITDGTTLVAVIAGTTALKTDMSSAGGTAISTGTGAGGAGIPRVTVSNDSSILGTKTNNNAAPGATNFGVLPTLANAAAPAWTEGDLVTLSTDLAGRTRILGAQGGNTASAAADFGVAALAVRVDAPAAARVSPAGAYTQIAADSDGVLYARARPLVSYDAVYRLVDATAGTTALSFTFTANTDKQLATIYHAATATKEVLITRVAVILGTTAAGVFDFEIQPLSATTAPATGNPAITPGKHDPGDVAAEATCLALPTTAGSVVAVDSPIGTPFTLNAGASAAVTTMAGASGAVIELFNAVRGPDGGVKPLKMIQATAGGYAVIGRSTTAVALTFKVVVEFTERTP
jgi:hypothetical protein